MIGTSLVSTLFLRLATSEKPSSPPGSLVSVSTRSGAASLIFSRASPALIAVVTLKPALRKLTSSMRSDFESASTSRRFFFATVSRATLGCDSARAR